MEGKPAITDDAPIAFTVLAMNFRREVPLVDFVTSTSNARGSCEHARQTITP